jgi:hypothetical protein
MRGERTGEKKQLQITLKGNTLKIDGQRTVRWYEHDVRRNETRIPKKG